MSCLYCNNECNNRKYCNRECKQKYFNKQKVGAGNCITCGENIWKDATYCRKCRPKKNGRPEIIKDKDYICQNCGKTYRLKDKKNGATTTNCQSCQVNIRQYTNKLKAIEYKGGKCELCGYNKCTRALNFHHIDPSTKKFGISGNHCRKWETVKEELDKYQLLCANCHAEIHEKLERVHPDGIAPSDHGNLPLTAL